MKYLVIFLYIYSTYLLADTTFLQKTSAQEMFALSKKEWTTNLQALEENGFS